jgi:DNA-directed RNA polymerase subunit RPC12/RpoP
MSTTYHAAAIVGCKIDGSKIFFNKEVRACKHLIPSQTPGLPPENAKFCSECGKKVWSKVSTSIPQYDEEEETLCGFRVFYDENDDCVFVAGEYTEIPNELEALPEMLDAGAAGDTVRRNLKATLKPLGLWDEKQFGIWLVTWYS